MKLNKSIKSLFLGALVLSTVPAYGMQTPSGRQEHDEEVRRLIEVTRKLLEGQAQKLEESAQEKERLNTCLYNALNHGPSHVQPQRVLECILEIIRKGADVNTQSFTGYTALHKVLVHLHPELHEFDIHSCIQERDPNNRPSYIDFEVEELLNHEDINIDIPNARGYTARDYLVALAWLEERVTISVHMPDDDIIKTEDVERREPLCTLMPTTEEEWGQIPENNPFWFAFIDPKTQKERDWSEIVGNDTELHVGIVLDDEYSKEKEHSIFLTFLTMIISRMSKPPEEFEKQLIW